MSMIEKLKESRQRTVDVLKLSDELKAAMTAMPYDHEKVRDVQHKMEEYYLLHYSEEAVTSRLKAIVK